MTTEQPPRDALRPLRPLASIGIPLLREERSAVRNRRLARVAVALAVLGLAGGGIAFYRHQHDKPAAPPVEEPVAVAPGLDDVAPAEPEPAPVAAPEPTPPAAAPAPVAPAVVAPVDEGPAPRVVGRYERKFGKALSFGDALRKAGGLNGDEADEVVRAMTGVMDFKHSHPEDTFVVERGPSGLVERIEYRAAPTVRFEATRDADSGQLRGQRVQLEIETAHLERGGTVEGSLGDALEGLGLRRALTGAYADVFSGKVNFSTETRRGDSFRAIVDEENVDGEFLRYGTIYALEYHGDKTGTVRAFWHESKTSQGDFYDDQGRALHGGWLRTPLRYDHVSSGFGVRFHPVLKRKLAHDGIDYAADSGTKVNAAAAGVVRTVGNFGPNGNLIAITHANGYETFYAHLSRFAPGLKPGMRVKQRQLIAFVGSTGRSTGPHLHFALKRNGKFLDPNTQLNGPGMPLSARELPGFKLRVRELLEKLAAIPIEKPAPVAPEPSEQPIDFEEDEL